MRTPDLTIKATRHHTAHEAIQHLSVSGDDYAIMIGGQMYTTTKAEVQRLLAGDFPFAFFFDVHGKIMSVPVGRD
jgi:hypothetical protein